MSWCKINSLILCKPMVLKLASGLSFGDQDFQVMSSQGQGVLEGETHGPRYAPQEQDDEAAGLVLNGSVSGEQRRSVSYGAVQRAEGVFH